ncbi:MAG: HNH endonuclease [Oribacterium sp.]|nr:HNH endonuclease [Oribacterium sp.]
MEEFVRREALGRRDDVLTELVNKEFGTTYTLDQVRSFRRNRRIPNGIKPGQNYRNRKYTPEMIEYLRDHALGTGNEELAKLMTERFEMKFEPKHIKMIKGNRHISSGLTGRFEKGHVPANKGKHPPTVGRMAETQFQKGHKSINSATVGTVKKRDDGYLWIKWQEFHGRWNWLPLQKYIWELAYGEVPKGYMVTFKDGNKEHIALDNLEMISMQQNVRMNSSGLRQLQVDGIFETAKAVANLTIAIAEAKKRAK